MISNKPILISGIQPSGKLHLGNYLGALKHFVELQNSGKYRCFFFIADYHSLHEEYRGKEKAGQITELGLDYLAAGIDPKRSVVFVQSSVPASTELAWILNAITPLGELRRMTQFKDKSEEAPGNVNAALFLYPVLMAADIILYDAAFVPVGDDQLQHLELTRTLVRKFNARFGRIFIEPKSVITPASRVMSLDNPKKKMAKSRPAGCLFLDDSPATIREKIARATTDSGKDIKYDEKNKPGISNLLLIYSSLSGKALRLIEAHYKGKGYAEFKRDLAEVVVKALTPYQTAKKKISASTAKTAFTKGNKIAAKIAEKKMAEVKKKVGLL